MTTSSRLSPPTTTELAHRADRVVEYAALGASSHRAEVHRRNVDLLEGWKTSGRMDRQQWFRACRTQLNLLGQIPTGHHGDGMRRSQIRVELNELEEPA